LEINPNDAELTAKSFRADVGGVLISTRISGSCTCGFSNR